MKNIKIIWYKAIQSLLLLFGFFVTKVNAQVIPFGVLHTDKTVISSQPPAVGNFYEGGIIFYIFKSGDPGYVAGETHGLIAAKKWLDSGSGYGATWWNGNYQFIADTGTGLGNGQTNTTKIIAIQGSGTNAASLCDSYVIIVGGITYDDWYLPSITEFSLLYSKKGIINATALANGGRDDLAGWHWTSSDREVTLAYVNDISRNKLAALDKKINLWVRAIRSF